MDDHLCSADGQEKFRNQCRNPAGTRKGCSDGKPLLIIAEEIEGEAWRLGVNKLEAPLLVVAVKAPHFGE